jgi:hypothetical protein
MVNFPPHKMEKLYNRRRVPIVGQCRLCGRPIPDYYMIQNKRNMFPLNSLKQQQVCLLADGQHLDYYVNSNDPTVLNETTNAFDLIKRQVQAIMIAFLVLGIVMSITTYGLGFIFFILLIVIFAQQKGVYGMMYMNGASYIRSRTSLNQAPYGQQPPAAYGQQPPAAYGQQPPAAYEQQPPAAYGQQPPAASVTPPAANLKNCQYCGAQIDTSNSSVCPICGAQQ